MGMHICKLCADKDRKEHVFENGSSGDTIITFASGLVFKVPDMILHYIQDHNYSAPGEFAVEVLTGEVVSAMREQTRSASKRPTEIGYLDGPFETAEPDPALVGRLEEIMRQAEPQLSLRIKKDAGEVMRGGDPVAGAARTRNFPVSQGRKEES